MQGFYEILSNSFRIILGINEYYIDIVLTSLYVSITATFIAAIIFIPLSAVIAMNDFIFKKLLMIVINS